MIHEFLKASSHAFSPLYPFPITDEESEPQLWPVTPCVAQAQPAALPELKCLPVHSGG